MRIAFATVNFSLVTFAILWAYATIAPQANPVMAAHIHPKYEVDSSNAPSLEIIAARDSKSGWNVQLITTNFTFDPESVGGEKSDGHGHVHLYVDGKKVARVYSEWFHLANLPTGAHTIRATLNTNDHADYSLNGNVIEASALVICEEAKPKP